MRKKEKEKETCVICGAELIDRGDGISICDHMDMTKDNKRD